MLMCFDLGISNIFSLFAYQSSSSSSSNNNNNNNNNNDNDNTYKIIIIIIIQSFLLRCWPSDEGDAMTIFVCVFALFYFLIFGFCRQHVMKKPRNMKEHLFSSC